MCVKLFIEPDMWSELITGLISISHGTGLDGLDHSSSLIQTQLPLGIFKTNKKFSPMHQNIKFKWKSQLSLLKIGDVNSESRLVFLSPLYLALNSFSPNVCIGKIGCHV